MMIKVRVCTSLMASICLLWQLTPRPALAFKDNSTRTIFASAPVQQQTRSEWILYRGRGEEFSVALPTQLSGHVSLLSNQRGKQRLERSYSAYADGVVYVILSYDKAPRETIAGIVKEFKEFHLFGGEMTFERDLMKGNFAGKQYRLRLQDTFGIVQFYLTDRHAYVVEVVSLDGHNPSIQRFLSSFILGGQNVTVKEIGDDSVSADEKSSAPLMTTQPTSTSPTGAIQTTEAVYKAKDTTRKAVLVLRPPPGYTEGARRNNVSGIVKLRGVLRSTGKVTDISVIKGLSNGLTELAVEAFRQIKFIPAIKDGQFVSLWVTIEYSFNFY